MTWLDLLLMALAAHRLWMIWFQSELTRPLKERLMKRGGRLGYLAGCEFCVSVHVGALTTGLWWAGAGIVNLALAVGVLVPTLQGFLVLLDSVVMWLRTPR